MTQLRRRLPAAGRLLLTTVLLPVALLLALSVVVCAALWWGSARPGSLETTLSLIARVLPAGQTLSTRNVQGNAQEGGTVQWLRWQQGALSVEVHDLQVTWSAVELLHKKLVLPKLAARLVHIEDRRPTPPKDPTPPLSLDLPLQVDANWSVATLQWDGAVKLTATELAGHYVFDSLSHSIHAGSGQIASGNYQLKARVGAHAPMALDVQLQGTVHATLPKRKTPLNLNASATLSGNLANSDSRLQLTASLSPALGSTGPVSAPVPAPAGAVAAERSAKVKEEPAKRAGDTQQRVQPPRLRSADKAKSDGVQATLSAELSLWQKQAIVQAKAAWQGLDPSTLWPDAPQGQLSGEATVNPEGPAWKARVQLRNAQSGPWDTRRLPIDRLEAHLRYANERWWIDALQAQGAGGSLQAQGEFSQAAAGWQGKATLTGVDLAAVDSRLAAEAVSGTLTAQQDGASLVFKADLAGPKPPASRAVAATARTARAAKASGLRLQQLLVQGRWTAPSLDIESLALRTDSAEVSGALRLNTANQSGTGQLTLNAPGITANANGLLSAEQGEGKLQVVLVDATLAARWLASLPAAPAWLATTRIAGEGAIDARWTGGWNSGLQNEGQGGLLKTAPASTHGGAAVEAHALHFTAVAQVPRLVWTPGGGEATPWRLRDGRATLAGTPNALQLDITGQAEQGSRTLQLQSAARITHAPAGPWQLAWNSAQLGVLDNSGSVGRKSPDHNMGATRWTLQLEAPVISTLQSSGTALRIEAGAGALRLTGPSSTASPGGARISWQPATWERLGTASTWRSTGHITDIPLTWLEALSPMPLTELGLRGDVVLGGQWDARQDGALRLQAHLERTAGDLQLLAEGDESSLLSAGVRVARLEVSTQGKDLRASARWDSERAGQLQAEFATRLELDAGTWSWPADAALSGRVKAQLPRVGAWSVLAPPGWRMRGTLDADATLAGTRLRPLWSGQLQAKDLAIRSAVDGIDFSRGTLRARLEGERLDIEEFTAQGAGAPQGGVLAAQGFVTWQAAEGANPDQPLRDRLRMEINATATALRVSARSDRRLALSGYLAARLGKDQLVLRGALTADQALFILPEDTTPRLGDDVRVQAPARIVTEPAPDVGPAAHRAAPVANARATPAQPATPLRIDVMVLVDLGKDFQVRGNGISTLLEGAVELRSLGRTGSANSSTAFTPTLNGTLRTAQGTYKAYGQQLDIEEGELRFTGPLNNPALNILAIRPNLTQRVGVQISGTALLPVVRLYADPDLAESEKLAWLVLGRSGANGGAEAALLQQAAMALLGSKGGGVSTQIADAFGLDEISVRGGGSSDGSATSNSLTSPSAAGATVTLGKRLSRDFYVAYERSLAGTLGTLSIFYDLSRRFTLRAQTGEQSAIDVIYTVRYD